MTTTNDGNAAVLTAAAAARPEATPVVGVVVGAAVGAGVLGTTAGLATSTVSPPITAVPPSATAAARGPFEVAGHGNRLFSASAACSTVS